MNNIIIRSIIVNIILVLSSNDIFDYNDVVHNELIHQFILLFESEDHESSSKFTKTPLC